MHSDSKVDSAAQDFNPLRDQRAGNRISEVNTEGFHNNSNKDMDSNSLADSISNSSSYNPPSFRDSEWVRLLGWILLMCMVPLLWTKNRSMNIPSGPQAMTGQ